MTEKQQTEVQHLYTPKDVARVRELLYNEQGRTDLLTGLPLDKTKWVTDHSHQTQFVRGVLHRQSNVVLGKLENLWTRYLSYWYPGTLQDFLRQCATYLDRKPDTRFLHPAWLKRASTDFNTLSEGSKRAVLRSMNLPEGGNSTERKKAFQKALLTRKWTFTEVQNLIALSKVQN